ncbi:FAD-dependent monooxygenase [Hyphomicrobium sp. 1Nfss2.1]|uniref:FAD-dependent monooxygenase n=1 Tax=Hyphomicrobium sp. 1Nfss2.1 TaxID=3413936 RepID=UPI003C7A79FB
MTDYAVIVAGGGPTGLMLGAELRLAGIDAVIIEKRADKERVQPGALGLHARTLEVFDQRGIADRFLAAKASARLRRSALVEALTNWFGRR